MATRRADYLPTRINRYVPGAQYAANVNDVGITKINFGATLSASNTTAIAGNVTANLTAGNFTLTNTSGVTTDAPFGRIATITASNVSTTGYNATLLGYDYLGQAVLEVLPTTGNSTVNGTKAFQTVTSANYALGTGNNVTLSLGWGTKLGLPYKALKVLSENVNMAAGTVGTLTGPNLTTQNSTTSDPRGVYAPNATPNAATLIEITMLCDAGVNSTNSTLGGLYGLAHYGG